ncbi:MAG: hypothetical protein OHK0022_43850 [Roseiflexaceae bacterium]
MADTSVTKINSRFSPHGEHTYRILETFSAVKATHPPAHAHGRDKPQS